MVLKEFALPDLGEGLTESEVVTWLVSVGDTVTLNQPVAEVETAKALVQLPSPWAGVVDRLHVEPGTVVPVGTPLLAIAVADDVEEAAGAPGDGGRTNGAPTGGAPTDRSPTDAAPTGGAAPAAARKSVLVGYGPPVEGGAPPRRRRRSGAGGASEPVPSPESPRVAPVDPQPVAAEPDPAEPDPAEPAHARTERPRTYPPVRKLAHDLGVDLAALTGSGPDGLITRDDVLTWTTRRETPVPSGVPGAVVGAVPGTVLGTVLGTVPGTVLGTVQQPVPRHGPPPSSRETRIPITGVRRRTAEAMVASAFTAPHATEFLTVDVTESVELVDRLRADRRFAGHRVTVLAVVAKAVLLALRLHPSLNARWDEDAGQIVQYGYVNLGIAAATPRGLLVPCIKDADRLDLASLAGALRDLTTAARAGTTTPADLTGGTFSVTNVGVFGIDAGTPILVPGEAGILATGAVRRTPWEFHGEVALRHVMTLSLSFDHRLVDGEQASRFLADVGAMLVSPGATLTLV